MESSLVVGNISLFPALLLVLGISNVNSTFIIFNPQQIAKRFHLKYNTAWSSKS